MKNDSKLTHIVQFKLTNLNNFNVYNADYTEKYKLNTKKWSEEEDYLHATSL